MAYDQIGTDTRRDASKEFWTPGLFMDELDNLLSYLGISECFDLVGQSWGDVSNPETSGRLKLI